MKLHKKRIRWGRILITFLLAFGFGIGFLGNRLTSAFEGDYWTVTNQDGLSITIDSVTQNGSNLTPQPDGESGFYFDTVDSTSSVTVGLRVNGMQPGETYYYKATSNSWDTEELTSEDNDRPFFQELIPYLDTSTGQYRAFVEVEKSNNGAVWKELVFHPAKIASQRIEVISVKQNDVDLALTNNEYQVTDYNAPVRITYKLKNLEIGSDYSGFVGGYDHYSFKADATEKTETRDLRLNYVQEHINSNISLSWGEWWESNNEYLQLYFRVADENFVPLGDIIIDEIEQGGSPLSDPVETISDGQRKYTFTVNDAQGLVVRVRATEATDDMNYYLSYNMNRMSSGEQITVTGEELKQGVVLTVPAAFGRSDESPFTLDFSVNTLGANAYSYGQQMVVYKSSGENQSVSDVLELDVYEDEDVPRYGASMRYTEGDGVPEIDGDRIDPRYVDLEHPLVVRVEGERYNDEQVYNVRAMVSDVYGDEVKFDQTFTATGAELNSGKEITLEGLTLSPPEFDADDSSWYEVLYSFSLEIDGLRQSGSMYCGYSGWINSLLTFDDGEVAAMTEAGSLYPSMYVDTKGMTVRKTTLGGVKNATLQYLGSGFDEDLDFEYAFYYNDDVSDFYSSAGLGERIGEGTVSGSDLNHDGLSVLTRVPDEESDAVFYSLIITRDNKIVRAIRDYIRFTDEPEIESFKFSADSDSFMQTDRTAYRVARDTDITATLTGSGFEDETEYKLWVSYGGARFGEEVDEWGYSVPEDVDLSDLDDSIIVTGAQLNAGYEYVLAYDEVFNEVVYIDVGFAVSDIDVDDPDWYGNEEGSYSGHGIHIDYVNDDEVFRDNGYQVNEDGTITDVSQPDDPHGPDEPIPVDDRAVGVASWTVEGGTLTVVSERPVMVVGHRDNGEWVQLYEWDVIENGEERTNHYSIGDCTEVVVALRGNLKDDDTTIDLLDANVIYRSQLNPSSPAYKALTPVEEILADLNGDHNVDLLDANVIYRSQLNPSSPAYQEISW